MSRTTRRNRIYQPLGEPPPGTIFAVYGRYSSIMQNEVTLATQDRLSLVFGEQKGWLIHHYYHEPAESAKYDEIERRPVFARMLEDAGTLFQGIIVYDNSRWTRNEIVGPESLRRLRAKGVWWATADGKFTIDSIQEEGPGVWYAIDTKINATYLTRVSKRVISGKEERALQGWHASHPPYGYLHPDYMPPPPVVGTNWRAPRAEIRPDPASWPALRLIAELRLARHSCREIAIALNQAGYRTRGTKWHGKHEPRLGDTPQPRLFTKDTIFDMLHNPIYREFTPGCGKGMIVTAEGERVIGQHQAAWDWDTWHKMEAVAASLRHTPQATETQRATYPFGGVICCHHCGLPMRCMHADKDDHRLRYYRCSAGLRMLPCAASVTTPAWRVERAFGQLLLAYRLGDSWRADLQTLAAQETPRAPQDAAHERARLEAEQEAYNQMLLARGIDHVRYQRETTRIQAQLVALERETRRDGTRQAAEMQAGEMLVRLPELWEAARAHDDLESLRELALSLLQTEGLTWDGTIRAITAIAPHPEYLPSLRVALPNWQVEGERLICPAPVTDTTPRSAPAKGRSAAPRCHRREPPVSRYALTPAQEREAFVLLGQHQTMRTIAAHFHVSRGAIWRLAHRGPTEEHS